MTDALWYIGSILVLAAVSLWAGFEQIDHDVDREFDFRLNEGFARLKISESQLQLLNEYNFWESVYNRYYVAWVYANSKENKLKTATETLDYGEIVLSIGDAILGEKED